MNPELKQTRNEARFSWHPRKSSSTPELVARALHVLIGLVLLCASVWAATYIESPYQVIYIVTMLLSLLMIGSGLYARRETVFKAFLGYWC
jgi:hypothetical protein